ncbi:ricin-type beta-trefoil lectin domain protein [Kitasatospora indigofera]
MGTAPSTSWGTGASDVPPSFEDGATPVPAAPELGTNLAQGRATSASAPCAAAESSDKAVDSSLRNNSKWCSTTANASLQVDLGSAQTVASVVVKHAGLGGENTAWNTGAFQVQTSTDGAAWSTAATVTGSRSSRTYTPFAARSARYVRVVVSAPSNTGGNTATRLYELEAYASGPAAPGTQAGPITSGLNTAKCVDDYSSSTTSGNPIVLWDCNGSGAQNWTAADGALQVLGKCLDVTSSGTANGTLVQLWDCNGTGAQQWQAVNGTLVNPNSGRCLDVPASDTTNGVRLDIRDCGGGANQKWNLTASA